MIDKKLDLPVYLFHEGTLHNAWELMGAHLCEQHGVAGARMRVWAPRAQAVSIVGDFNDWDSAACPMRRLSPAGLWEGFAPHAQAYDCYKFHIRAQDGSIRLKSDPYAFYAQLRPDTASRIYDLSGYQWQDDAWQAYKQRSDPYAGPLNIYELHAGSWRRGVDGEPLSYAELAEALIPYVKRMGYTHVELLPIMEYPYDGSWGYQSTGYFAVTARYGTPHDFMRFVDALHGAGIGVILDFVPAHFPKDAHGLYEFDGSCCYEYEDAHMREHPHWGTRVFDFGRAEVRSFLLSSALFWAQVYHVDGLRVDAVASMLYLDYGREPGAWRPNEHGGRENLQAVALLRSLNEAVQSACPGTLVFAEESTAWPMVTKPAYIGGLGFNFKWNMGWMNDLLRYMQTDPFYRRYKHDSLTFSIFYAFAENFVLPLSHDEVVHGKKSLLDKMPGQYEEKFANLRLFLAYMMAHPGKKLHFMGNEFGQFIEWDYQKQLDWQLLEYPQHRSLHEFVCELNHLYLQTPALWRMDCRWEGFEWIAHDDYTQNVIAWRRLDGQGGELICVCNFSNVRLAGYTIGVPQPGTYHESLNTDDARWGGADTRNDPMPAQAGQMHGLPYHISMTLPALGTLYISRQQQ